MNLLIRCFLLLVFFPVYLPFGYLHAQPTIPEDPDKAIPDTPLLTAPDSGAVDVEFAPLLEWEEDEFAESYELQLATNQDFTDLLTDTTGLTDTKLQTIELGEETTYYWRVKAVGDTTDSDWSGVWHFTTKTITYAGKDTDLPGGLELRQNYPNPFNPITRISYGIPENVKVQLAVYDVTGRRVATLVNQHQLAGRYSVTFDAAHLASGVYTYRIIAGDNVITRQATLMK